MGCSLTAESVARLPGPTVDANTLVSAGCDPADTRRPVEFHVSFSVRFQHPGGWIEQTNLPGEDRTWNCVPL